MKENMIMNTTLMKHKSIMLSDEKCQLLQQNVNHDLVSFFQQHSVSNSSLQTYDECKIILQVPWWNKRTRMERRLMLITICLTVVAGSCFAGIILMARDKDQLVGS